MKPQLTTQKINAKNPMKRCKSSFLHLGGGVVQRFPFYILRGRYAGEKTKGKEAKKVTKKEKAQSEMRQTLTAVVACYLLSWVPSQFNSDLAWDLSLYVRDMQVAIFAALVYSIQKSLFQRTILMIFLIYTVVEAHLYLFQPFYDQVYTIASVLFVSLYFYNRIKSYNYQSDPIGRDNIYFCFWKPRGGVHLLSTLIGQPFGGMSVLCRGQVYGFRWDSEKYEKKEYKENNNFVIIDTGILCNDVLYTKLESFLGASARHRTRCISILKPFLRIMGPRFEPSNIELLPSIYAKKVIA